MLNEDIRLLVIYDKETEANAGMAFGWKLTHEPKQRLAKTHMKIINLAIIIVLILCIACTDKQPAATSDSWRKVELDLSQLDDDGLRGPPDGDVAVSYEFCIPNTAEYKAEVKAIDQTVQFMPGSRGRVCSDKNDCLCIGSTHRENYRQVILRLAELPYIKRIIECHFESRIQRDKEG